jgi:aminoglycoside phosphotransferase (APT) family kinase protein
VNGVAGQGAGPSTQAAPPAAPPGAALAAVPGLEHGAAPLLCQRLPGGTVNDSWRVETHAGRFVLRIDGPAWRRPGVDRPRELVLHGLAAAAGLAAPIVRALPEQGLLVCEYLPGADWAEGDFADRTRLVRLGDRLRALHALPAPQLARFDPAAILGDYLGRADELARSQGVALGEALAAACRQVQAGGRQPAIIHGDLVHTNLRAGRELWLLDWEYAQVGDPAWDIGCILAYYPAAQAHLGPLLIAAGLAGASEAVLAARYVYAVLSWAWHRARGEAAALPGRLA